MNIEGQIAAELNVKPQQVAAAVELLDGGATVPFISRYRKEVTQGLDDTQLRELESRLGYLRELEDRRGTILKSIEEQEKLTPQLEKEIRGAATKTELEDLYLPYKQKRRTKAQIAREAGLEPLADALMADPMLTPEDAAKVYINTDKGVADEQAALDGARQILMERFAEDPKLVGELREYFWENAVLKGAVVPGKEQEGKKFSDYFDYSENLKSVPSHRALALFRGRNEGFLTLSLDVEHEPGYHPCEGRIAVHFGVKNEGRPADAWRAKAVTWTWKVKLHHKLEVELNVRVKEAAEESAIDVFGKNLGDLLLAAPAGTRSCMGLDPGIRTGVKVAIVDGTGKVLATSTIYPHQPRNQWDASIAELAKLIALHKVDLVSIGNGTASRETDKLVADLQKRHSELTVEKIMVSEAGASVYSASELAAREFPDMDVSLRGAVSIARRLQDPLAELVKIDPKAIGVGQYQHDVNQTALGRKLVAVVEDCVNAVGVDANTASAPLLARVSGMSKTLAENVVQFRDENGAFTDRKQLKKVPRLGAKTFEQAAGFLRIMSGVNPLDSSAVHPEAYPVVKRIIEVTGKSVSDLMGDSATLRKLDPAQFTDETFGLPTVKDILQELEKPGRDPRPDFKTATFKDGVSELKDLRPDMILEGVVTNVTHFGAFVDVGVHQDGLVHISQLSNTFVDDPHKVVSAGLVVKVKVMEVDLERKRVGLTMKLEAKAERAERPAQQRPSASPKQQRNNGGNRQQSSGKDGQSAMAAAFAKAKK